jgi:hypothetical protein
VRSFWPESVLGDGFSRGFPSMKSSLVLELPEVLSVVLEAIFCHEDEI